MWILLFLVSCFLFPATLLAQQPLTLKAAVGLALQNNPSVKAAQQSLQATQALEKTAFNLDPTQFVYQGGQINTAKYDNYISAQQTIAWPGLYSAQGKLLQAQSNVAATQPVDARNELGYAVQLAYLQLCFLQAHQALTQNQAELMATLATAEEAKYKAGAINALTVAAAVLRREQLLTDAKALSLDITAMQRQLGLLLQAEGPFAPDTADFFGIEAFVEDKAQDVNTAQNPLLLQLKQQVGVLDAAIAVERAKLKPSFSVGYFFQGIEQKVPFQGWFLGFNVPIWQKPQRARIENAELSLTAASTTYDYQQDAISVQAEAQRDELTKQRQQLDFYLNTGLQQAALVLKSANTAYKAGELELVQYLMLAADAQATRVAYLNALMAYHTARLGLLRICGTAAVVE